MSKRSALTSSLHHIGGRALVLAFVLMTSACTNQNLKFITDNLSGKKQNASGENVGDDSSGAFAITAGQSGTFTPVDPARLFPAPNQPTPTPPVPFNTFDIVGDNKGSLGELCQDRTVGGTSPNTAQNPYIASANCTCEITWTENGGLTQTIDSKVVYVDRNMVKCANPISSSSNASEVYVRIKVSALSIASNKLKLPLGTGTAAIEAFKNYEQFSTVNRFTCAPESAIPYAFDPRVVDPIQSKDLRNYRYMSFYSTSAASSILNWMRGYIGVTLGGTPDQDPTTWRCPKLQGYVETESRSPASTSATSEDWIRFQNYWLNDLVFTNPDQFLNKNFSAVDVLLDPRPNPANRWNASSPSSIKNNTSQTFYLAKQPANVANTYTVAVVAKNYPDTLSAVQIPQNPNPIPAPAQIRTLGYGVAAHHPSDSESVCPNDSRHPAYGSIMKPASMKWAKLWQFRSNFEKRTKLEGKGSDSFSQVGQNYPILCNPGSWSSEPINGNAIFNDCSTHYRAAPTPIPEPSQGMCEVKPSLIPTRGRGQSMSIRFNCKSGTDTDPSHWTISFKTNQRTISFKQNSDTSKGTITKVTNSNTTRCACAIEFKLPSDAPSNFNSGEEINSG